MNRNRNSLKKGNLIASLATVFSIFWANSVLPAKAFSLTEDQYLLFVAMTTCADGFWVEGHFEECYAAINLCLRREANRGADGVYSISKCYKVFGSKVQGRELMLGEGLMAAKYLYNKRESKTGLECLDHTWIIDRAGWGVAKRACSTQ